MNILIITHEFPPLNTIGAQRPYSWAKYWSQAGHNVCVLSTVKESFDGPIDTDYNALDIQAVRVEEVSYWPFPQQRSKGKKNFPNQENQENHTSTIANQLKILSKKVRKRLGMGAVFSVRDLWIRPAVKHGISLHQAYNFDCMVSTYGPPAPHRVASRLKQVLDIPWIADYRDLWHGTHYQDAQGFFSSIQKWIEDRTVSKADLLTTVSNPLRDQLSSRFEKEALTIENGFDNEEVANTQLLSSVQLNTALRPDKNRKIVLAYTGKIRFGKQCVLPFFEALHWLKKEITLLDEKIEVLFYGTELGEVPQYIVDYDLENIVQIAGFLNRRDILTVQRAVDGLLFFDWKDTSIDGILTGKIFEYLFSGTIILGIGSNERLATGQLLQESGCGVCVGTSPELIVTLLKTLLDRQQLPYAPNQDVLMRYTRKGLAQKMLNYMLQL